jgi:ribonuclease-3|uniref:RNase III domain-containing protein n=1 Tax=viral metagenome TaxID=1070528 RepID=A0A6C0LY92_9ZZZZ
MKRIQGIHNKTQDIEIINQPYNNKNILLQNVDLQEIFNNNGLNNIKFKNIDLYRVAFVHKSYCTMKNIDFDKSNINCPADSLPLQDMSYERLEFLGDSLIGMIVANYLYNRFPDQNEGFLSKIRTKIVNGRMLGYLSDKIGFPKFAIISKQVEETGGRNNFKIMEDIFEAFIGALFLDFQTENDKVQLPNNINISPFTGAGYFIVESFIIYIIENYIDFCELIRLKNNYKDMLVSYMTHNLQDIPKFYEVKITIKDNIRIFTYCIKDRNNSIIATSTGTNKKEAENNTAKEALIYYNVDICEYNSNI